MAQRVIEQLSRMASERPESDAIIVVAPACSAQRRVTYSELNRDVIAASNSLRAIGNIGDVVMLCAANQPAFIAAFLGALRAGMIIFPVHPGLTRQEIGEAARRSGANIIISSNHRFRTLGHSGLRLLDIYEICVSGQGRDAKMSAPADGGLMLQTSGTTGTPKIVFRNSSSLDAVARNVSESLKLTPDDRVLAAMPLCHSYGVENGVLAPILAGAAIHVADGFDPTSITRHFQSDGITVFPGVPFMYQVLAERSDRFDMPRVRLAYSAGSSMPKTIEETFTARFGVRIGQLYGSTEMGSITFGDPFASDFVPSSVGKAMHDVRIVILDPDRPNVPKPLARGVDGLVAVAAPSMLERYVDDPSPALVDGYFFTGDLGHCDGDANLIITGRIKLQIDIGGMKVNPLEVEQVLAQHPLVRECVVIPEPVTHTLNRLKAIVSVRYPDGERDAEQFREFVRQRLASYKVPRLIEFRDALPKSPSGKILREALRCD